MCSTCNAVSGHFPGCPDEPEPTDWRADWNARADLDYEWQRDEQEGDGEEKADVKEKSPRANGSH